MRCALLSTLCKVAVVAAATLGSASCSYIEWFFVANQSERKVWVHYSASTYLTIDGEVVCSLKVYGHLPQVLSADLLKKVGVLYLHQYSSPAAVSEFDRDTCSVKAELEPKQAILVWATSNGNRDPFLRSLAIVDGDARTLYDKFERIRPFRRQAARVYAIEYRGSAK